MRDVDNSEDVLDSRDVQKKLDEMEEERADLQAALDNAQENLSKAIEANETISDDLQDAVGYAQTALTEWDADYAQELKELQEFVDEASGSPDWVHGETLIRDSYFTEYAQELAEDIDALKDANQWPLTCIDWEWAARELKSDYMSAEWGGVTYWIRA